MDIEDRSIRSVYQEKGHAQRFRFNFPPSHSNFSLSLSISLFLAGRGLLTSRSSGSWCVGGGFDY